MPSPLESEIIRLLSASAFSLSPKGLYLSSSIKSLLDPHPDRPDLEIRQIKRTCNSLVKQGLITDIGGKSGEGSGPYSSLSSSPIEIFASPTSPSAKPKTTRTRKVPVVTFSDPEPLTSTSKSIPIPQLIPSKFITSKFPSKTPEEIAIIIKSLSNSELDDLTNEILSSINLSPKYSGAYSISEIQESIGKFVDLNLPKTKPAPKFDIQSIDSRIKIPEDVRIRIEKSKPTKEDEELISLINVISPNVSELTSYVNSSSDFEMIPISIRLEKEGSLSPKVWASIIIHQRTGTRLDISSEKAALYGGIKSIINRLDKIKNQSDQDKVVSIFFKIPDPAYTPSHTEKELLDKLFNEVSSLPESEPDYSILNEKINMLTSTFKEDNLINNLKNVIDSHKATISTEIIIDNVIRSNASSLKSFNLNYGNTSTSRILFSKPVSPLEAHLKSISSSISLSSINDIISQVQELMSLPEPIYDSAYDSFLQSKTTGYEEAFIYLHHNSLMDKTIYDIIQNKLKSMR